MTHPAEEKLMLYFRQLRDEIEQHGDHVSGHWDLQVSASFHAYSGDMRLAFKVWNGESWTEGASLRDVADEALRRVDFKKRSNPLCLPRVGAARAAAAVEPPDEIAF